PAEGRRAWCLGGAARGGSGARAPTTPPAEPIQIDQLSSRPPWVAVVMEDGSHRHYRTDAPGFSVDAAGVTVIDHALLHCLDLGANYWSLWTEAENVARYREQYPAGLDALRARIGYRVRPSWVWQRKRD